MKDCWRDVLKVPNLVSLLRILLVPVLLYFAFNNRPYWFLGTLLFSSFTDLLDGFLARRLDQITELGSRLDSWGDFAIYSTITFCAWVLWPEIVAREFISVAIIFASFTLPVLVGLVKFRRITSYHTLSVKLAVFVTIIGYILIFAGISSTPFHLAAVLCAYAATEEIAIRLVLKHSQVDVLSLWHALRYKSEMQGKK